jgi:cardiolipin synthase A/B
VLHTTIIGSDDIAVLSSGNRDLRSLELDLQVTVVCYNRGVEADMQQLFADELRHARRLYLHEWQTRPLMTKRCDQLARLRTPLQE